MSNMPTKEEKLKILRYAVASYVSFVVTYLCGFRATTSIAFSAILVLMQGAPMAGALRYGRRRMLAQLISVPVGTALYYACGALNLPASQRTAVPMTLGLVIVLYIRYRFRLEIIDLTMFTPVFLVQLMLPGNGRYPLLRLLYCLIGVVIGIALNALFQPRKSTVQRRLDAYHRQMAAALAAGPSALAPGDEMDAQLAALEGAAQQLAAAPLSPAARACCTANAACTRMLRNVRTLLSASEVSAPCRSQVADFCTALFVLHAALLHTGAPALPALPELPLPQLNAFDEVLVWAEISPYYRALRGAAAVCSSQTRNPEGADV